MMLRPQSRPSARKCRATSTTMSPWNHRTSGGLYVQYLMLLSCQPMNVCFMVNVAVIVKRNARDFFVMKVVARFKGTFLSAT